MELDDDGRREWILDKGQWITETEQLSRNWVCFMPAGVWYLVINNKPIDDVLKGWLGFGAKYGYR